MMGSWVLIFVAVTAYYGHDMSSVEFATEAACKAALERTEASLRKMGGKPWSLECHPTGRP